MNGVWGLLAAGGVLAAAAELHLEGTAMLIGAVLLYGLVGGGLKAVWAANDRRAERRAVEDEERVRVRVRKELAD